MSSSLCPCSVSFILFLFSWSVTGGKDVMMKRAMMGLVTVNCWWAPFLEI